MFKMLKYEWRKNILSPLIVLGVFAALEVYFLIGCYVLDSLAHVSAAISFLVLAAVFSYIFVLLYGIISYSSDLKNKSGYLVFMAPISSFKILGSKLLSTLITGVLLLAVICGLAYLDFHIANDVFGLDMYIGFGDQFLSVYGSSVSAIIIDICIFIITFLLEFYMIITVGYLAVSLSSTALQNKKCKGFVSLLLFIVIIVAVFIIAYHLPMIKVSGNSYGSEFLRSLPQYILLAVVTVCSFIGSSLLLEKKISL